MIREALNRLRITLGLGDRRIRDKLGLGDRGRPSAERTSEALDALERLAHSKWKGEPSMPHYKDGTKAEIGDTVRGKVPYIAHEIQGVVVAIFEGAETCNLQVAFPQIVRTSAPQHACIVSLGYTTETAKDFEKIAGTSL